MRPTQIIEAQNGLLPDVEEMPKSLIQLLPLSSLKAAVGEGLKDLLHNSDVIEFKALYV